MKATLIFLILTVLSCVVTAQETSKEYNRHFPKAGIEELVLNNRFGKMEIVQTDVPDISVQGIIKVSAKSLLKAEETLYKINIRETRSGNYLNLETVCDQNIALKKMVSGLDVKVNYKVIMPKGIKLRIISVDGDVYMGDFTGELNVDVSNGNFKAVTIGGGDFFIKQSKGDFSVDKIKVMTGEFKDCNIRLQDGGDIHLTTQGCTGNFESIDKLNIRSNGGNMKFGDIEDFFGSSSSTKFEIQELANSLDMDMKMGEMNVRNVQLLFSEIRLKTSFTKVGFSFPKSAGYKLEIKHNRSLKMQLPDGVVLEERPTASKSVTIGSKFVGDSKYKGKVFMELSNGNLFIQ